MTAGALMYVRGMDISLSKVSPVNPDCSLITFGTVAFAALHLVR